MTQDERWQSRYDEVKAFIEANHREEKLMVHFLKRGRKQMNAGVLKPERVEKFRILLELTELYKRKNQYQ